MDAVGITLTNPSAFSSMRAVYGGMHLVFGLFCIYGIFKEMKTALTLIVLYTAGFAIGRVTGIIAEGAPNEFVNTWLLTELFSGAFASVFLHHASSKKLATPAVYT